MGRKSNQRDKSQSSSSFPSSNQRNAADRSTMDEFGGVPSYSGGYRNPNSTAPALFDESAAMSQATNVYISSMIIRIVFSWLVVYGSVLTPDEIFQGPEVAHRLAFGYGFLTWDWLPGTQIRSAIYPALFAIPYKLFELLRIDSPRMITLLPLLIQSAIAAVGDCYTYRLAFRLYGYTTAQWAIALHLTTFWVLLYSTRTLTTSVEAVLFVVALYYWPLPLTASKNKEIVQQYPPIADLQYMPETTMQRMVAAIVIGVFSCIIRPTSAIPWTFLGLHLMYTQSTWKYRGVLLVIVVPAALYVLLLQVGIDRLFLGDWVLTTGKVAILRVGVDVFTWLRTAVWYMSVGLLALCGTWYPLAIFGVYKSKPQHRLLLWMMLFVCTIIAWRKNAEIRAISLLASPCIVYAAYGAHCLMDPEEDDEAVARPKRQDSGGANATSPEDANGNSRVRKLPRPWLRTIVGAFLAINFLAAASFLFFNQRGGTGAMDGVRRDVDLFRRYPGIVDSRSESVMLRQSSLLSNCTKTGGFKGDNMEQIPMRVHIWAKCHQAPMYSHIHFPIEIIQLDCSPKLEGHDKTLEEEFVESPDSFLREKWYGENPGKPLPPQPLCSATIPKHGQYMGPMAELVQNGTRPAVTSKGLPKHLPTHVIVPDALESQVQDFLHEHHYIKGETFSHTHFTTDPDSGIDVRSYSLYRSSLWSKWFNMASS
eukprot:gb/GECG01009067.1/.p1 GENE.gb/GECG01009067.1/~~gb/GECG01009067.1/.p1  ORF type:complete len:706 (+),score=41.14 gb/GECG01009067.1/:1-2118(+)